MMNDEKKTGRGGPGSSARLAWMLGALTVLFYVAGLFIKR